MLRRNLLSAGMLLTAGGLVSTLPGVAGAAPKKRTGLLAEGVAGTWASASNATGELTADVLITKFAVDSETRTLKVHGLISKVGGNAPNFTNRPFVATGVLSEQGAIAGRVAALVECNILELDIGAIHLDLLGLVIDLAPIHLDIVADPSGGLLGQLLCAIANLLNGTGPLTGLRALLQQINQLLSSILAIIG
jgi:hypothetical protein